MQRRTEERLRKEENSQIKGKTGETQSKEERQAKLHNIFNLFDLDGGGAIEASELSELGKARRSAGQKKGEWTKEKNARMLKKLDLNGDGQVSAAEFVKFFEEALPQTAEQFDAAIDEFEVSL